MGQATDDDAATPDMSGAGGSLPPAMHDPRFPPHGADSPLGGMSPEYSAILEQNRLLQQQAMDHAPGTVR